MIRRRTLSILLLAGSLYAQTTIGGGGTGSFTIGTQAAPPSGDFYASPSGSGSSCTLASPCSLTAAIAAVRGTTDKKIVLRGGLYPDTSITLTSADSGTPGHPIVWQAYGSEVPVLSGGERIFAGSWVNTGASCGTGTKYAATYTAGQHADFESLFYNGERRYRPRSSSTYLTEAGSCFSSSQGAQCVQLTSAIQGCSPPNWVCFDRFNLNSAGDANSLWSGLSDHAIIVDDFEQWTKSTMRVSSISGTLITLTGPTFKQAGTSGFMKDHRLFFENIYENLGPGTWYLATTTPRVLYYCAAPGEDPTNAANEIIIPQQSKILQATGLHDVTFQGITFAHDSWIIPAAGLGDQQGMPYVPAAISFVNTTNVVFDGVTERNVQGWGVEFIGDGTGSSTFSGGVCTGTGSCGNQVLRSRFYDIGADPIRIGRWPCVGSHQQVTMCTVADTENSVTQHNLVQDNVMAYTGRIQPTAAASGCWIGNSHHNKCTHNEVHDYYDMAFSVGFTYGYENPDSSLKCAATNAAPRCLAHDNEISYNWGYQAGRGVMQDVVGGAYFAAGNTSGNTALHNKFTDAIAGWHDLHGYGGNLLYFDQGSTNVVAQYNVLARSTGSCFNLNPSERGHDIYPQNNLVDNNVMVDCGSTTSNNANNDPEVIRRDGSNPNAVTFSHNVIAVDLTHTALMAHRGGWFPNSNALGQFNFHHNLWWNRSSGNSTVGAFIDCKTSACSPYPTNFNLMDGAADMNASTWNIGTRTTPGQANTGEDFGSIVADPLLTLAAPDNYVPGVAPAGFVSFDPSQAGRQTNTLTVPTLPDAWPAYLLDPDVDWGPHAVLLRWEQPDNSIVVASQNIYRGTTGCSGSFSVIGSEVGVNTSYADTTISHGNLYSYRVTNVSDQGAESLTPSNCITTAVP